MLIECPSCAARYEVPDDRLAPGRTVRCARCGREWTPLPPVSPEPAPEASPDAVPALVPTPVTAPAAPVDNPAPPAPRPVHPFLIPPRSPVSSPYPLPAAVPDRPRRAPSGLALAWIVTVAVLAGAGWAAVEYRGPITRAWPPSQRVYDAVRLPAD